MNSINTFGPEITKFRNNDLEYIYSFNSAGNLSFSYSGSFNQVYLMVSGSRFGYDDSNINKLLDISFSEFSDTSEESTVSSIDYKSIADQLNDQVLNLQSLLLASQQNSSSLEDYVSQINRDEATIIALRISLGQGKTVNDFSTVFPYLPLVSGSVNSSGSLSNNSPATASISNPLASLDSNGDGMLSTKEIRQIPILYRTNPVLQNLIAKRHNGKAPKTLSKIDLDYIVRTFYMYVDQTTYTNTKISSNITDTLLKKFDINGNKLLDKTDLKLIKQQFKVANPVLTQFASTGSNGKYKFDATNQQEIYNAIYTQITGSSS